MPTRVPCPTCGKPVPWSRESRWRPFCSERCKLLDLGDWLDETHRISDEHRPGDRGTEHEPWPEAKRDDRGLPH